MRRENADAYLKLQRPAPSSLFRRASETSTARSLPASCGGEVEEIRAADSIQSHHALEALIRGKTVGLKCGIGIVMAPYRLIRQLVRSEWTSFSVMTNPLEGASVRLGRFAIWHNLWLHSRLILKIGRR
jgi:hypothetical protein